ncbi:unnamed protein product [Ixodes pacificus]
MFLTKDGVPGSCRTPINISDFCRARHKSTRHSPTPPFPFPRLLRDHRNAMTIGTCSQLPYLGAQKMVIVGYSQNVTAQM